MNYFKDLINTMGFPIGVSAFLLIRIEKKLDQLNNSIIQLMETFVKQDKWGWVLMKDKDFQKLLYQHKEVI